MRQLTAVGAIGALVSVSALAQNRVFSTHDFTPGGAGLENPRETWADAKMPGGFPPTQVVGFPVTLESRLTYVVGTIEVRNTDPFNGAVFSGVTAGPGVNGPLAFTLPFGTRRQVVMTQINSRLNVNGIQRYFYGQTPGAGNETRATNARGISVWRDPNPLNDRIAICGETYDEAIIGSQAFPGGWAASNANSPSGFIAVYNGNGDLLWTHHFFAGVEGYDQKLWMTA